MRTKLGPISLLCLSALCACTESESAPATRIVVEIDAEPRVRALAQKLEVVVEETAGGAESSGGTLLSEETVDVARLPERFVLVPHAGAESGFVLTVTAYDADERFVAQARVISDYVSDEARYARLVLEDACDGVDSCDRSQTCAQGRCVDARVDPSALSTHADRPSELAALHTDVQDGGREPDASVATPDAAIEDAAIEDAAVADAASQDAAASDAGIEDAAVADAGDGSIATDGGHPPETVDECATNHGGCDPLVSCTDDAAGAPSCGACPAGYSGTGATGCSDIDECATNHGGCDPLVTCTNHAGSAPTCGTCEPGTLDISGDGSRCATAAMLSAHDYHTCAVLTNGRLYCWGANDSGQLGVGTSGTDAPRPVPVGASASWQRVGAGALHTCGIDDGKLLC